MEIKFWSGKGLKTLCREAFLQELSSMCTVSKKLTSLG